MRREYGARGHASHDNSTYQSENVIERTQRSVAIVS